jgi:hypothetical protein
VVARISGIAAARMLAPRNYMLNDLVNASAADVRYCASLCVRQRLTDRLHQGSKHCDVIAGSIDDDYGDRDVREVLLVFQSAIDRKEDIELRCRQFNQCTVLNASPAGLSNGPDLMLEKLRA